MSELMALGGGVLAALVAVIGWLWHRLGVKDQQVSDERLKRAHAERMRDVESRINRQQKAAQNEAVQTRREHEARDSSTRPTGSFRRD